MKVGNTDVELIRGWDSFFPLLTLMFIWLKLTNELTWGWEWILAPLWIPIAFAIGLSVLATLISGFISVLKEPVGETPQDEIDNLIKEYKKPAKRRQKK